MTNFKDTDFRPLYQRVRERLLARMVEGAWAPGESLPSEQRLASEYGVSQGTVRKALDSLADENLIVRHQGRGTFVAIPGEGRLLFQFYSLRLDDGTKALPISETRSIRRVAASEEARQRLQLRSRAQVWEIRRSRSIDGHPMTAETLVLPAAKFPDLDKLGDLPNNVYVLYATRYRQTVGRAEERLKAVAASADDTKVLACVPGTPLLLIDRVAYALDGAPIEWRLSRCLTDVLHYRNELR